MLRFLGILLPFPGAKEGFALIMSSKIEIETRWTFEAVCCSRTLLSDVRRIMGCQSICELE